MNCQKGDERTVRSSKMSTRRPSAKKGRKPVVPARKRARQGTRRVKRTTATDGAWRRR